MSSDDSGGVDSIFSYRIFRELEKRPVGVMAVAGFRGIGVNLGYRNQTRNGSGVLVSGAYFSTLGIKPLAGRFMTGEDGVTAAGKAVAVVSYGYWRDRLGSRLEVFERSDPQRGDEFVQPTRVVSISIQRTLKIATTRPTTTGSSMSAMSPAIPSQKRHVPARAS